ncbi:MAG: hypothetical protein RIC55_12630 [Pirellulaceae bacterium]
MTKKKPTKKATHVSPSKKSKEVREYEARVKASNEWTEQIAKARAAGKPTPKRPAELEPTPERPLRESSGIALFGRCTEENAAAVLNKIETWLDALLSMKAALHLYGDWGKRAQDAYRLLRLAGIETPIALDDPPSGWSYETEVAALKAALAELRRKRLLTSEALFTDTQKAVYKVLQGRILTVDDLEAETKINRKQLYGNGVRENGIHQLRDDGWIALRRGKGYYRPNALPPGETN